MATAAVDDKGRPLTRVLIVSRSPLMAEGLKAALSSATDWRVDVGPRADEAADVLVMQAAEVDAGAALPETVPLVLIGDAPAPSVLRETPRRTLAWLSSSATPQQLQLAVSAVLQGLSVRDASGDWGTAQLPTQAADHEPLSPREIEVYELLAKGLSNRDIAGVLEISVHTAKYHVGQILAKVGAATRAEAVSAGLRMGIIGL